MSDLSNSIAVFREMDDGGYGKPKTYSYSYDSGGIHKTTHGGEMPPTKKGASKKAKLSKIIGDVNKKNAPPGGWSEKDKVTPKAAALAGKKSIDTSNPKMQSLISKLKADPKVKDPEALAAYIARRAAASKGGKNDKDNK